MKISELLTESDGPLFSFEFFPPKDDVGEAQLWRTLDKLVPVHPGFVSVTYMPSRNTEAQLERVRKLCKHFGFFEISGEDINTPRQNFICVAQRSPQFAHLALATMALIGHEKAASRDISMAMFGDCAVKKTSSLEERIKLYSTFV